MEGIFVYAVPSKTTIMNLLRWAYANEVPCISKPPYGRLHCTLARTRKDVPQTGFVRFEKPVIVPRDKVTAAVFRHGGRCTMALVTSSQALNSLHLKLSNQFGIVPMENFVPHITVSQRYEKPPSNPLTALDFDIEYIGYESSYQVADPYVRDKVKKTTGPQFRTASHRMFGS